MFIDTLLTKLVDLMIEDISKEIIRDILSRKSVIRVFVGLKLMWCKSNMFFNNKYSWISASVYYMDFSSYKVLNRDLFIVVLNFSI